MPAYTVRADVPQGYLLRFASRYGKILRAALFNGGGIWYNGAKQRAAGIFFAAPAQKEERPMNMEQYRQELMDTAKRLFAVDSPSGFTADVVTLAKELAEAQGYAARRINKGNLAITVPGRDHSRTVGVCAHIDTLGLMCRAITEKGELLFTRIGGPLLHTLDGEYCRIHTRDGRVYTGTILSLSPSVHVYDDADSRSRDEQNMYVRIDEPVRSRDDVTALGIAVGDYICIDTKTTVTDSGYLKSRFIDDKGSAACLLTALKIMRDNGIVPQYDTEFYLTVYEEVGHGGADIPASLSELLAVDMGCIGGDLTCTEQQVSICVKDSAGPYDYEMTSRLMGYAKAHGIDHAADVYPHYGSDVGAAWRAGGGMKAALIGPGVHASHGMERTHWDGLKATMALLLCYLTGE